MYFVRNKFKGVKARYQKFDKLVMVTVIMNRNLWPYFQGHKILVKINYHVRQVLKKLDMVGRMVSWAVKLWEYDAQYVLIGSINS